MSLAACRGDDPNGGSDVDDGPTATEELACEASSDCPGDEVCVGAYEGEGGPGDFTCTADCVPEDFDELWCADDAACCEGLTCDMLGFCVGPGDGTGG